MYKKFNGIVKNNQTHLLCRNFCTREHKCIVIYITGDTNAQLFVPLQCLKYIAMCATDETCEG